MNINATALHLTDLMLFSLTPQSILQSSSSATTATGGGGGCCLSSDHYSKIRLARAYKKEQQEQEHSEKIRLLLTVGGAGRSEGFRDIVTGTPRIQRQFLEKLVQLCFEEQLDGIDFDFEGIQSLTEWAAYVTFLKPAADYLHHNNLLLTVALHPEQYLPHETCLSIDRVHVMTYDMASADKRRPHHHASMANVHDELSKFKQNGCPPHKLVMGIPAYGRHTSGARAQTFSEAVDEIMAQNFVKESDHEDRIRDTIHASIQSWKGYQFDSPRDVVAKVGYAVSSGLGGVFLWELGQDKQIRGVAEGGILLEAAASSAANMLVARRDGMSQNGGGGDREMGNGRGNTGSSGPAEDEL